MKNWKLQYKLAMAVLLLIIISSILAPLFATYNPFEPDIVSRLQGPSWKHYFGTDALGRDMFSRILYGGQASMLLSIVAAILALGLGLLVGLFGGFYGGWVDTVITVISNIFQGLPGSCFMIAIAGIFGASIESLVVALVMTSWAGFSRIVRAEVLQLKEEPFIEGLRCIGCSDWRIMYKHIVPHLLHKLLVLFTIRVGRGILAVAGLSFIGLGVQPPTPDWSVMINDAMMYYRGYPHLIIIPGLCIFSLIYSLNILGEGLRDMLDVRFDEVRKW